MKKKLTNISLWILAVVLTIAISYYQKSTGPTWPVKISVSDNGEVLKSKLLRSYTTGKDLPVNINAGNSGLSGSLKFRRYGTDEVYTSNDLISKDGILKASIPSQPPAGKVEYIIELFDKSGEQINLGIDQPVVARFKGEVSPVILIFHILFMFAGVMLAIKTLINCIIPGFNYEKLLYWTFGSIFIGGIIFGPIVQKSAFGDYWTGFPFGTDLTDNKVLISLVIWGIAIYFKKRRAVVIVSALFMLFIYFIPHSVMGSELDYKTGKMKNKFSHLILKDYEKPDTCKIRC